MIGLPISIFITGDRAKAFDWISVTTVCIDLSIDAMTNFLNAISIHCNNPHFLKWRGIKMANIWVLKENNAHGESRWKFQFKLCVIK